MFFEDDQELRAMLKKLPKHQPRPGYEQRFWARVDQNTKTTLIPGLRWGPAVATGLGLVFGMLIGFSFDSKFVPKPDTLQEITLSGGLPSGSLAATVVQSSRRLGK